MTQDLAKWLYFGGIALFMLGALINFFPQSLSWFGKLPGDIRIQNERISVFVPITSMLISSVVVTIIANLVARYMTTGK